ncbi:MAG: NAD(P) transhydrogenase subunit alpha [Holosporales bacterium]|jgi:NAD(P) transhydrogenase subunit alpha|nr:NAD(P) transhydrogenase subunit alpha [Holosporales bacterium]
MKLFVLSENHEVEKRVAVTPEVAKKLVGIGHEVYVESDAGKSAGFDNEEYSSAGAAIAKAKDVSSCNVVFAINPLQADIINEIRDETILIGMQEPYSSSGNIDLFLDRRITAFALDLIPRTTRAQYMDVLSSQASLAGYKAIIEASSIFNRGLPLMITTAGTVPAAKVLIIGAGVAGLQAIATAKRLGAIVSAFDIRTSAKEQVESLGAKFIEVESTEKIDGVYAKEMGDEYRKAQEMRLRDVLPSQDIVVTTAQIPGKKAPVIIKADMVGVMKKGSILIDLASNTGGNCELTESGKTVETNRVKIVAFDNILNFIAFDASRLFAKNAFAFFELLTQKMADNGDISAIDDEIIKATLVTHNRQKYFGGLTF